ncbi:response regulator [Ekhidna sp.]|uniref:response regulator n=1 Tax=Ekhidna sp. TaxID=2608089 RepID=UPI003C79BD5B
MTKRIVLIDDDNTTNYLNKFTIERSNVVNEVITFASPLEALDYLNSRSEDEKGSLILLDINMPVMSGWELLKHYGTQNGNKAVDKVVMLTSSIDPRDQELANENSLVTDIRPKPLSLRTINDLVKTLLK